MKFIFTFICLSFTLFATAQRCGTPQYAKQNNLNSFLPSTATTSDPLSRDTLPNEVIVVPVVIHVLYHSSAQNIRDQQVLSQLTVLNNDYRRLNADAVNTPAPFKSVAADARIVFCLAKVDPNGRYTSGIIHKYTNSDLFQSDDEMKFSSTGGDDAWDSKKYLNIWVCNLFGRTLGYAVMPGGPAEKDGVVIQYTAFGTLGTVIAPFNKGRTATHEIGHWLGLKHLWGDAECGDDGIADTPPQETSNSNCATFPHLSSCSINSYGDMFMDFMDFTDDACMNMFTQGQKNEMRGLFALGNPRNSFLNSSVCDSSLAQGGPLPKDSTTNANSINVSIYPNPFSNQITIKAKTEAEINGKTVKLYDVTGKLFLTQTINAQTTSINVTSLPSGMYFLKVEGGNVPKVFKLIKQKNGGL
ncbi:T9SS type A sorting domain-containing protein [Ginsengibacter hankyongi]|uniref:T9SS type A sorting domain-containing protein n=1 Tax=Ginsengibacter hankyongi TaxID=2607284 RepID=A0A5J5IF13_9BACT|nr:T9SS type A sorting domain-containing protein [Ginsengibacter hankyongi]KAA9038608.1 T9SS type A sorting domain-containing protein [Ginsengibacter hankyongi]